MNLFNEARKIFERAQYITRPGASNDTFYFEDSSLFGFVWTAPSAAEIINQWQARQDEFLKEKDRQLTKSKDKSWNVYSVLLTDSDPTAEQSKELTRIEENFRGTRKIARAELRTGSQVTRALFPLMRIQNLVVLGKNDATRRLRGRLSSLPDTIVDALLGEVDPPDAAQVILRRDDENLSD